MVDIMASFQAVASSLTSAGEITRAILGMRDEAKIHTKVMELNTMIMQAQGAALSAQTSSIAHVDRIRDLEKRIVELENWDREKQRYQLHEVVPGVFAYALKEDMRAGEPAHQVCARCYQDGIKSILHKEVQSVGRVNTLVCDRCGSELITSGMRHESHARPKPRGR